MRRDFNPIVVPVAASLLLLSAAGAAYYFYVLDGPTATAAAARGHGSWSPVRGRSVGHTMTPAQFARENNIDPRLLDAFIEVESGPLAPVGPHGPVIRLEVHHLLRRAPANRRAFVQKYFNAPNEREPWKDQGWRPSGMGGWLPLHVRGGDQEQQYRALNLARHVLGVDSDVPFQAISIGRAQIMGFHYQRLGYRSARAMWEDARTLAGQDRQFIGFISTDPKLVQAMQRSDMREMIRIYNGPGQVGVYLAALQRAYNNRIA